MAFGQRPQHPAAPVDAADERGELLFARPVDIVDDQSAGRRFVHSAQSLRAAASGTGPAGLFATGRCAAVDRPVVGLALAGPGAAPTTAPPPAPTWLRFFAFRHPSDSSWRAKTLPGALAGRVLPGGRLGCPRPATMRAGTAGGEAGLRCPRPATMRAGTAGGEAGLRSPNVPETTQDADLLTAAAVALNRHADVLRELGSVFAAAGHELYLVGGVGARCAAGPAEPRSRLHHQRPARAGAEVTAAVGRCVVGHRDRVRHRRRGQG